MKMGIKTRTKAESKVIKKNRLKIIFGFLIVILAIFLSMLNSEINKNTNYLEEKLSKSVSEVSGITEDLFDFEYDKIYVFEPYQSKAEMEEQIGFKSRVLKEVVNEGMVNILFVKNTSAVAYLYGYPSKIGYYIDLSSGKHTKAEMDSMHYKGTISEVGNSSGSEKTYIYYTFK